MSPVVRLPGSLWSYRGDVGGHPADRSARAVGTASSCDVRRARIGQIGRDEAKHTPARKSEKSPFCIMPCQAFFASSCGVLFVVSSQQIQCKTVAESITPSQGRIRRSFAEFRQVSSIMTHARGVINGRQTTLLGSQVPLTSPTAIGGDRERSPTQCSTPPGRPAHSRRQSL